MATYTPAVGPKMQYDRDGSTGFFRNAAASLRALTSGEMTALSGESGTNTVTDATANGTGVTIGVIFPDLRDIVGFLTNSVAGGTNGLLETSINTTTGIDGSWVTQAAAYTTTASFRGKALTLALTGIKGIRITSTNGAAGTTAYKNFHVYGTPSTGQSSDRLRIWHPTLNQELTTLDFGDPARESTYDVTFRLKNNSTTLNANSVVLSTEAITDASPTVVSQESVSQGSGFASTQTFTLLAPATLSAVCTLRINVAATAVVGPWRQRLKASAGSWTAA